MTAQERMASMIEDAKSKGLSAEEILNVIGDALNKAEPAAPKIPEKSLNLEQRVTDVLMELGMPAHILGFRYARTAIIMVYEDPNKMNSVTKVLYPEVAKRYMQTSSRVERAIRHGIETAWDRATPEILEKYFGYTIKAERGKPTNSEFIAMLADKLALEDK